MSNWMNERMNKRSGRTARKHNPFTDTVGWQRHKKHCQQSPAQEATGTK